MSSPPQHEAPVLLTGATGFIGRRIQHVLLNAGIPLRITLRPGSRHPNHADPRCELRKCSLDDAVEVALAVAGARAIVYCAGSVRGRSLEDFLPANVNGVRAVLQALADQQAAVPFLLISSLAANRPGLSDYARSKYLGEEVLRQQARSCWAILRLPAVYGPGDTEMAPILKMARSGFIARLGPEQQRVSLLYADDVATAVIAWLNHWQNCQGMTYAIDDGRQGGYDWRALAQAAGSKRFYSAPIPIPLLAGLAQFNLVLSRLAGYAPMLTPGKVRELTQPDWLCDNTGFVNATGWQPQTGLPGGIRLSLGREPDNAAGPGQGDRPEPK
jgi:nucleoside-diphosphate-sugar epimerase